MGPGAGTVEIGALAYDARRVAPGALFFCVPGFRSDGHDFAADAVAAGAVALVVERPLELPVPVPQVRVPSVREAMATAAARFAGDPTAELEMVGITGTNGKTTTAFLVRELLEAGGRRCGLMGTVKSIVGGRERPVQRTTPEAIDLQRDLRRMLEAGDRACAIEVSSHALALHRADAIHWAAAVFTNLSQDHLDFHPDMEAYLAAKRRLLEAGPRIGAICVQDGYGRRLATEFPGAATFALDAEADFRATVLEAGPRGTRFSVQAPDTRLELALPLPGRFNVLNALGALVAARGLGVADDVLVAALGRVRPVPGRFEAVDEGQAFAVVVDYAHTPDGLRGALQAARELAAAAAGRVLCVFGCGGDRDRGKRPLMGAVAAGLADRVIVTSDNPRSEDPEAILAEVLAGAGPDAESEPDRRAAIELALGEAEPGDVVLVAGKGHEQGQEFAQGRCEPFDDVQVAREALRALGAGALPR